MTASAQQLIDTAPLGALIASIERSLRPAARFKRKFAARRRFNGFGQLDSITPAERCGARERPARFALHVGECGSYGVDVLSVRLCFDVRSTYTFAVSDVEPGSMGGFVTDGVRLELGGVFADHPSASTGFDQPRDERAFLMEVGPHRSLRRLAPRSPSRPLEEDRTWAPGPRIGSMS